MAQPFLSDNKNKENVAAKAAAFFMSQETTCAILM
jgi:hypothetical protein